MITLVLKNKEDRLVTIHASEIVSIDGQPYKGQATDFRDDLIHLGGRLAAVEAFIASLIQLPEKT